MGGRHHRLSSHTPIIRMVVCSEKRAPLVGLGTSGDLASSPHPRAHLAALGEAARMVTHVSAVRARAGGEAWRVEAGGDGGDSTAGVPMRCRGSWSSRLTFCQYTDVSCQLSKAWGDVPRESHSRSAGCSPTPG